MTAPASDRLRRLAPLLVWAAGCGGALLLAWCAWWTGAAALAAVAGVAVMAVAFVGGLAAIRAVLRPAFGITGVARAVLDEAVRMRTALALVIVFVGLVPVLSVLVDAGERLAYRMQFLIGWTLGGSGVILSLLTIFLACGSVCGDIDSGRIHMTLVKPVQRWEYLAGKWLGIVLYDLLLVTLAGAATITLVRSLAAGPAADAADREAVDRQVLVARRGVAPGPDRPDDYEAAIAAAIARLEADDPESFGDQPAKVRQRIRHEYAWQWHTVTPDMETTFVFHGLGPDRRGVQLQLEPRVTNVDVDLADVRCAVWLNGRPWPMRDGVHAELTLASRARHVFDLPPELLAGADELRVRIANRNLVPPGETRPTAITFPPGEGLKLLIREGGFETNLIRCLVVIWAQLALLAAVGVAAGAVFDLPLAILAALIVYVAAVGNEFFGAALGTYNVVAETGWERVVARAAYTADFLRSGRWYQAFRMVLAFVTDVILQVLPSFSADAAVSRLAAGMVVPLRDVLVRLLLFAGIYPLVIGGIGWLVFDRRDLVRSSS